MAGVSATGKVSTYRDLKAWQAAMDFVEAVYRLAADMPDQERFGLSAQMRRAAVSVPANIAEGHGRRHLKEYLHHLFIARGSLMELETHLLIVRRLQYASDERLRPLWRSAQMVGKLINGLIRGLGPVSASSAPTTQRKNRRRTKSRQQAGLTRPEKDQPRAAP